MQAGDAITRELTARISGTTPLLVPVLTPQQQSPLLRAYLLTAAPDNHILLLVMHHIVADGWSLGVLMNELAAAYAASPNDALRDIDFMRFLPCATVTVIRPQSIWRSRRRSRRHRTR